MFAHSLNVIQFYLTKIGPYHVLPLQVRVDQGAMAMKGFSTFPKVPRLGWMPYPLYSLEVESYPLYSDAVSVFYSPSWLGCFTIWSSFLFCSYFFIPNKNTFYIIFIIISSSYLLKVKLTALRNGHWNLLSAV